MENEVLRFAVYDSTEKDRELAVSYISEYYSNNNALVKIHRFFDTDGLVDAFRHDSFAGAAIGMNSMREVDAAWIIKKIAPKCRLVIMSESGDYSMEGFRLEAFDYWLKPLVKEKVNKSMERMMANHAKLYSELSEKDLEGITAAGLPPEEVKGKYSNGTV